MRLEQIRGVKPLVFDEASRPELRKRLPTVPGAAETKTVSETVDALPILNWKSFEIVQTYQIQGEPFRRSVLFLDISGDRVLQLTVYALERIFDGVHGAAIRIMSSWFEPSRDLPPDLARVYEKQDGFLGN